MVFRGITKLQEADDVSAPSPLNGQVLAYDGAGGVFRNVYRAGDPSIFCSVARGSSTQNPINLIPVGAGFYTLPNDGLTVRTDQGNHYNVNTYIYTVPVSGVYKLTTKLRLQDGDPQNTGAVPYATANGFSYGHGVHTSNVDGPWFAWFVSTNLRNGSLNIRTDRFNAGDQLRAYCYHDSPTTLGVSAMSMTVEFLSP